MEIIQPTIKNPLEERVPKIETVLEPYLSKAFLPDSYTNYISNMIIEDPPRSSLDLNDMIGQFFQNNIKLQEEKITQFCEEIYKTLQEKNLINQEGNNHWVAEKLNAPLLMADVELITEKEQKEGYADTPFTYEKFTFTLNDMMDETTDEKEMALKKKALAEKHKREEEKRKKREKEAFEKHMRNLKSMRNTMPKIEVLHRKGNADSEIRVEGVDLEVPGKILLSQADFFMGRGRKYGLIGRNGIGKTTLLYAICRKEFKGLENAPQILLVEQEVQGDDMTVIDTILSTDTERAQLLEEEKKLLSKEGEDGADRLTEIYEKLDEIGANQAEAKARILLHGLGFTPEMQDRATKHLSGGWRMRVALAKVLFCEPEILLLDEPTNHLDLDAVMWLQDYLINWEKTLLIVSHARNFLNNVCTDIINYKDQKLHYYKGNYDMFEKVKAANELQSKRTFEAQQKKMSHMQDFIDKFRFNSKRASLVQSRIKYLNKLDKVEKVLEDPTTVFMFDEPEKLRPPIVRIDEGGFGYTPDTTLLRDMTFTVDMQSKVAVLGANGVGKTTFLKILTGELEMRGGSYFRNQRARIATFSQHHVDHLDISLSPFEQFAKKFPKATTESLRAHLSKFGITGNLSLRPIYLLSGGQKARVALAMTAWGNPHVMIMDEPTNHLDIDAVDALVVALSNYTGGLIIVSHDQYFVSCICDQIWYIKDEKLKRFTGGFDDYRTALTLNKL